MGGGWVLNLTLIALLFFINEKKVFEKTVVIDLSLLISTRYRKLILPRAISKLFVPEKKIGESRLIASLLFPHGDIGDRPLMLPPRLTDHEGQIALMNQLEASPAHDILHRAQTTHLVAFAIFIPAQPVALISVIFKESVGRGDDTNTTGCH